MIGGHLTSVAPGPRRRAYDLEMRIMVSELPGVVSF